MKLSSPITDKKEIALPTLLNLLRNMFFGSNCIHTPFVISLLNTKILLIKNVQGSLKKSRKICLSTIFFAISVCFYQKKLNFYLFIQQKLYICLVD